MNQFLENKLKLKVSLRKKFLRIKTKINNKQIREK